MINSYRFGQIEVNGRAYTSDLIILPSGAVKDDWWRRKGHELGAADIEAVIEARPDVLIVGTGESGMMKVLPETEKRLRDAGIELVTETTADACETFNRLSTLKKAAALHLTC